MTVIWGRTTPSSNSAFGELDPQAFNAARMTLASAVFLAVMAGSGRPRRGRCRPVTSPAYSQVGAAHQRRMVELAALGLIGHSAIRSCFIGGWR